MVGSERFGDGMFRRHPARQWRGGAKMGEPGERERSLKCAELAGQSRLEWARGLSGPPMGEIASPRPEGSAAR